MKSWCLLGIVVVLSLVLTPAKLRAEDSPTAPSTADLELQVAALTSIDDLDLTPRQMKDLHTMALDTASTALAVLSEGKKDPAYHDALLALRDALVSGNDDKIGDAEDKVDELREKLDLDPNVDEFPTTGAAKKKAEAALKMISTSQLANYISMHSEDVPDALDTIMDAIDQCKDGSRDDFDSLRQEAAQQVALLAAGPDQQANSDISKKVSDLLEKAYKMKDPGKHREELEEQARDITKSIDSFDAMRRWMLREMADMLSNPQFKTAISLRTKAAAGAKKTSEE
jgi:hypothetical protein